MARFSKLVKEKSDELGGIKTEQIKVQQIHYSKLKGSPMNFYKIEPEEVRVMADNMLISGGILAPLTVRKTDLNEYEIISGHKRKAASLLNVERGYPQYEFLPCIVKDVGGLLAKKMLEGVIAEESDEGNEKLLEMLTEYLSISANSTAREISPYEKMMQSVRLTEILPAMLEDNDLRGRALRAEVAKEMNCGDGQVGRYQAIYNKLTPDAMKLFKDNIIPVTIAYGMSGLSEERQQELLKGDNITTEEIERLKEVEKEEKESQKLCEGQLSFTDETVSESDTEFNPDDYEKVEWTYDIMAKAIMLVFEDENFPIDVLEELLSDKNDNAQYFMKSIEVILPFENRGIRVEYKFGFKVYFKDSMTAANIPLYPFWDTFMKTYNSNVIVEDEDSGDVTTEDENNNIVTMEDKNNNTVSQEEENQEGGKALIPVVNSRGYSRNDVEDFLLVYKSRIRDIEVMAKHRNMSKGDLETLRKARMIRDGLACLLDRYEEVKDRYLNN